MPMGDTLQNVPDVCKSKRNETNKMAEIQNEKDIKGQEKVMWGLGKKGRLGD
jgi:hypothetical protein